MIFVHSIIFYKEDEEGNKTYYTTNLEYDHSMICDLVDDSDLIPLKEVKE